LQGKLHFTDRDIVYVPDVRPRGVVSERRIAYGALVDFADDYKTMDSDYMESVIWAFGQLWDKGLIYEAHRVMPYSWGAETPLSNFEIRLDDATRPRQDPALTVAFTIAPDGRGAAGEHRRDLALRPA
jgi:isoleucyl-tRNA synthetase